MNILNSSLLERAEREAVYNVYMYLAAKTTPTDGESLGSIVAGLQAASEMGRPAPWSGRDRLRLSILTSALAAAPALASSKIGNIIRRVNGLYACSFTSPDGSVSVVFKGTGSGEWIDNGEGLSGVPEENTYITYGAGGTATQVSTAPADYATDQQAEALNWFNYTAAKEGWRAASITLSGHSKGGNKAQFITVHSDRVKACFTFDGHGFSPEALASFEAQYGTLLLPRREKIISISAANDYVNVLGERLPPEENIYFVRASGGLHYMEAMLTKGGRLNPPAEQGALSRYIESVSEELMSMPPHIRQHATLAVMNIFQKYYGRGTPVNGDSVSTEQTVAGIAVAIGALLRSLGV